MIKIGHIERFATHDGEGIRTTVFFQGCPLRCPWCANPESQELTPTLFYDVSKCVQCRACERLCPSGAIAFENGVFTHVPTRCNACKLCEKQCIHEAIEVAQRRLSVDDIMNEIRKDDDYYKASGGGVTLSGGEPFVQFEGMKELLIALKKESYNVAVETTGQYTNAALKDVHPYIDTFLFDVKHINDTRHKKVLLCDTKVIQENLQWLCAQDAHKVVLRVPLIVDFNDDEVFIQDCIALAARLRVRALHLLPYHTLGKSKFDRMQRAYPWSLTTLDPKTLIKYIDIAKKEGVVLCVGG